jgi:hypothetical protein
MSVHTSASPSSGDTGEDRGRDRRRRGSGHAGRLPAAAGGRRCSGARAGGRGDTVLLEPKVLGASTCVGPNLGPEGPAVGSVVGIPGSVGGWDSAWW